MLSLYKELQARRKTSGFTLMEMLVVIAIVAVLVVIAIPIFTQQLEEARNRTDAYNARTVGNAIQIYYMTHPEEIDTLLAACKKDSKGYLQICVGPTNAIVDPVLAPALEEAGLLPEAAGTRYKLSAMSKATWIGYYIAVAGPTTAQPNGVRIEYAGIPLGETQIPYKYYASFYWPTNRETTGFNKYVRGLE